MNAFAKSLAATSKRSQPSNPFARALANAELEQNLGQSDVSNAPNDAFFRDALARTGGQSLTDFGNPTSGQFDIAEQQRLLKLEQDKQALRKKLHDQVNPVDTVDIFNAREQQVKKEIEDIKYEIKKLVEVLEDTAKDAEITTMTETPNPGQTGKYYLTFFQQLKSWVILLRQKVQSARTWATQMHAKNSKKKHKGSQGMIISGQAYEQTTTVQDMLHHERSSQYSGG